MALLDKLAEELSDVGVVEQTPLQDGRNMTMMLAPSKAVLSGELDADAEAGSGSDSSEGSQPASSKTADAGSNGHHNGASAKTPEPSDATA